jgi:hypothetical protein
MTEKQEKGQAEASYNAWDSAGDGEGTMWFLLLPERSLDQIFGEDRDMLSITKDGNGHWIARPDIAGQSCHDDLAEAKAECDQIHEEVAARQSELLLKDAGLSSSEWTPTFEGGFRFVRADGAQVVADLDSLSWGQSWSAFAADSEDPVITDQPTIGKATSALPAIRRTKP